LRFEIFRKRGNARSVTIHSSDKGTTTPIYFPSVSTSGNQWAMKLVKFLLKNPFPCMLISAYDFYHLYESDTRLVQSINNYSINGKFLLVDSGGYERRWNDDQKWDFNLYKVTMQKIKTDFYTSLDVDPSAILDRKTVFKNILDSYAVLKDSQFLPIFDGTVPKQLITNIEKFLDAHPNFIQFIAVRERDLGVTLSEKARTIYKIRKIIDDHGNDQILHVLGCGHPLSLAVYSYFGADSFDSRDWYLKTLDTKCLLLRDLSHLELMHCNCDACKTTEKNLYAKTLIHNITCYLKFINDIQRYIKDEKLREYLLKNGLNTSMLKQIES
jgi:queuine/archaeosine tRNA-ribosyltransferase